MKRLPHNMRALFYISSNVDTLDNILNYAEILDAKKQSVDLIKATAISEQPGPGTLSDTESNSTTSYSSTESSASSRKNQHPKTFQTVDET